jgi:hypothetical protein
MRCTYASSSERAPLHYTARLTSAALKSLSFALSATATVLLLLLLVLVMCISFQSECCCQLRQSSLYTLYSLCYGDTTLLGSASHWFEFFICFCPHASQPNTVGQFISIQQQ